jgi:hypothetical protein
VEKRKHVHYQVFFRCKIFFKEPKIISVKLSVTFSFLFFTYKKFNTGKKTFCAYKKSYILNMVKFDLR